MLTVKRSAGVTPEVNLRNRLYTGDKVCKQGVHPGFKMKCQMSKIGETVTPTKTTDVLQKFEKKRSRSSREYLSFQRNVTRCPDSTSHTNTQIDHLHRLQLLADDIIDYRVQ